MRRTGVWLAASLVVFGGVCRGGPAPAAPEMPKAESILKQVPAGALAYIVVNDVKGTLGRVEKFLADVGLAQMMQAQMGGGGAEQGGQPPAIQLLPMLRAAARLGEGFNPNGGFAVVMLDPRSLDIDLMKELGLTGGDPSAPPARPQISKVPFALIVCGSGVKEVFGAYEPAEAGKYAKIRLGPAEMLAARSGGYVVLSPMERALEAVLTAKAKAAEELSADEAPLIGSADVAVRVNMEAAAPLYKQLVEVMQKQMGGMGAVMPPPLRALQSVMTRVQAYQAKMLAQMTSVTFAGRLVGDGLVFDGLTGYKPGSQLAGIVAAIKPTGKNPVGRLANLPYVLAIGNAGGPAPGTEARGEGMKIFTELLDTVLADEKIKARLPVDFKDSVVKIVTGLSEQVTGCQMVAGGAPAGSGLFGLAIVTECKDADAVKAVCADIASTVERTIKTVAADEPDAQKLGIKYVKGAETAGGTSVDAIQITHPEIDNLKEDERAEMGKVLGETKIRLLIAAPDKTTVVMTFGGGVSFLEEALKAAKSGGSIDLAKEAPKAVPYMPKTLQALVLFNGRNLFDVIMKGMKVMAPEGQAPPFQVTGTTPLVMGSGVLGKSQHGAIYVPNSLVKDGVGIVMGLMMRMMGPPGGMPGPMPPETGPDF